VFSQLHDVTPGAPAQSRAALGAAVASVSGRDRPEDGSVTAETVMVLPVLIAVTIGLAWLLALAATQVRVVDAARETARAAAREDSRSTAVALGRRVAPDGARFVVREEGDTVVVRVRADVRGPGGLFAFLPGVQVDAEAVAAREPR
jgi:hypothetical protein